MKRQQTLAGLVVLVLIAVIGYLFAEKQQSSAQSAIPVASRATGQSAALPLAGHMAPNFTLTDLQGRTVSLLSLRGRPVVINFFASWCPPCKMETPDLVNMYQQYGEKVQFLAVNMAPDDTLSRVQEYVRAFGVPYPVLLDSSGAVEATYGVIDIPTSFFIDSKGVIMSRVVGFMPPVMMRAKVAQLLGSG